jgi:nitrite reductase/ring-hydroxylating ferredoxin subunit
MDRLYSDILRNMPIVKVGPLSALPPGSVVEVTAGGAAYAVCNVAGDLYALAGECPHRGGPLGWGALHDSTLVCPWHAWEFDCRTGEDTRDPTTAVRKFPVKVQGGDILLEIP